MIALACSGPTEIDRAPDGGQDAAIDARAGDEAPEWCRVQAILALKCQRCHASPAAHGAPFALVTYDDTQVRDHKGHVRFERIAEVVEERSMPAESIKLEPPVEPLAEQERTIVLDWCAQGGGLTGSASCEATR